MSLWIRYDASRNIWEVSPNETEHYFSDLIENFPREVKFGRWIEFEGFADAKTLGSHINVDGPSDSRRINLYNDGDFLREIRSRRGRSDVWGPSQLPTLPGVSPSGRTRLFHDSIDNRIKFSTNGSAWQNVFDFERGGILVNSNGITAAINVIAWRAPYACTVRAVKGYRVSGTGATVNARKNGSSNHLSSNLSLTSADTWMDGGAVQNTSYNIGDKLEIMAVTVTGSPTQIGVQVELCRP